MANKKGGKAKGWSNPQRSSAKPTSKPQVYYYRICEEIVNEPCDSNNGDDSVLCNGLCDGWIHRRCAGLSVARFSQISTTEDPFFCPNCCAVQNKNEIDNLKLVLSALQLKFSQLKSKLGTSEVVNQEPPTQQPFRTTTRQPLSSPDVSNSEPATTGKETNETVDKKYNLVLYGIAESPNGTPKSERVSSDFNTVVTALKPLNDSLSDQSIRDCVRLGKYTS